MAASTPATCCPVLELRQYTLHPGQRDVLIELFDREFVESQEAEGMWILGQFRDLDKPDRFVWLRGYPDMQVRDRGLRAFYTGPVWKANSKAANATMIDATNVLLLRPARPDSGFAFDRSRRPAPGSTQAPKGLVTATIYYLAAPPGEDFVEVFERQVKPQWKEAGASILGEFVTESATNTFPGLPVREGENVFVVFSSFQDQKGYDQPLAERTAKPLSKWLKQPPEVLRLSPTARSMVGATQ